ncbi:MAG: SprB repeat-containing protein, partial [Bacteroidota bacterium]
MKKLLTLFVLLTFGAHLAIAQCDLDLTVNVSDISCAGSGDGAIEVSANAGLPPYVFELGGIIQTTNGIAAFLGLSEGLYSIAVTDADNCSDTITVVVTSPADLNINLSGEFTICTNGLACLDATVIGGTPGYLYQWSNGQTSTTFCTQVAGTYSVTVVDANGCAFTLTFEITESLDVVIDGDLEICPGSSTTLDAGTGFISYEWSTGAMTQSINANTPGNYSVTVTDAQGCLGIESVTVTEKELFPEINGDEIFCTGNSTVLDAGNYAAYLWSTGATTPTIEVSEEGMYTVTVTDGDGCTGTASKTVFELDQLQPVISGFLSVCEGGSTNLSVTTNFASYVWSTGAQTQTIEVTEPGGYSVTVSDASGCTGVTEVAVLTAPSLPPIIEGNLVLCSGNSTILTVLAPANFVDFQWSNGQIGPSITISAPGNYSVTTTDLNGCVGTDEAIVIQLADPVVSITGGGPFCEGATFVLDAGSGFINYFWSTGATTPTTTINQPGLYSVTVTDQNGCTATDEIEIQENTLSVTLSFDTSAGCLTPGSASASASGIQTPFSYAWSNGSTGVTATNLSPGTTYSLTVTDGIGCSLIESFTFPAESNIGFVRVEQDLSCTGANDGVAGLTNLMGIPPFSITWSDGGTGFERTGLAPGLYEVTLTDSEPGNCPVYTEFEIEAPALLDLISIETINPSCFDFSDGQILLEVVGGTTPYLFDWDNGTLSQQNVLNNISGGTYTVTVTDANACSIVIEDIEVDSPDPLEVTFDVWPVLCQNTASGGIDLTVLGGTAPYTFNWSGPNNFTSNLEDLVDLFAGFYSVNIMDNAACTLNVQIEVTTPDVLALTVLSITESCVDEGSVEVAGSGGVGNYFYTWSNGATTAAIDGLSSGFYTVTLTDDQGCTVDTTLFVDSPIGLAVSSTPADCETDNGTATAQILGGANDPMAVWNTGATGLAQTGLAPGFYSVTVTDGETNCSRHQNVEVPLADSCFVRISGYVLVNDESEECMPLPSSFPASNVMLQLSDGQITFTNSDGYYEFTSETPDAYAVTINFNSTIFVDLCTDPITVNAFDYGVHYMDNNFYLQFNEVVNRDLNLKVSKLNARPGFIQNVRICLMNQGATPVSGLLTFVHPEEQEWNDAVPVQDNYTPADRTLTWNFADIPPNAVWVYNVYLYTP